MNVIYKINLSAMLVAICLPCFATDTHDHSGHEHFSPKNKAAMTANTSTYSCNLISHSSICRQYSINIEAKDTLKALKEGCESIPNSKYSKAACPEKSLIATCVDIVRNYHNPDVIYDNYYYSGKTSRWTSVEIQRVCKGLGGEYAK